MDESLRIKLQEPRIEVRGEWIVAGLRQQHGRTESVFAAMEQQWNDFIRRFDDVPDLVNRKAYGVFFDMYSSAPEFTLLTGVEAREEEGKPSDFRRLAIPRLRYAMFPHSEGLEKLRNTVWTVWEEWLPQSPYKSAADNVDIPEFIEVYGEDFKPETNEGNIEVWFPIKAGI
ncbi:MAG: GyrI-like domain-containing protein [Phyllobacterium sp.]